MTSIPLNELESTNSAKFDNIGDKHVGTITAIDHRQQTDPKTGEKKEFPSGDPMMMWVITIQPDEGDAVALWAKGGKFEVAEGSGESMLSAIGTAVRAANATAVEVGAKLGVAHTGLGKAKGTGMNAPKLYTAQYEPPVAKPASVGVEDLFNS